MDVILKKYFWVLNLVVIGLCATLAGRATAGMLVSAVLSGDAPAAPRHSALPPPPPAELPHGKEIEAIVKRNVFCSACAPIAPKETAADTGQGPIDLTPQKSSLQLQLLATIVSPGDPRWSLGVVRDLSSDRKLVSVYRRGEVMSQGATMLQVVEGRVYLLVGRSIQYLDRDGAPPPPPPAVAANTVVAPEPSPIGAGSDPLDKDVEKGVRCTGNACEVDKSLIDKFLQNTTALATSARFVPSSKDGKPNGFKVYAIRPGSVFAKIGMQNADLVKAINGLDMSTPDRAFEAYTKLKSASHLTMQLERRGENVTLDYQIR